MSFNKIVIFLITVIVTNINSQNDKGDHYTYLAQILKYKYNLFRNLHDDTQKIVNSMFDSLDLLEEFSKDPKIKLLLTMHYDLNHMAEKNFEMYDLLRNATAIKLNNTAINIKHLDEIVELLSKYRRTTVIEPKQSYATLIKTPRFKTKRRLNTTIRFKTTTRFKNTIRFKKTIRYKTTPKFNTSSRLKFNKTKKVKAVSPKTMKKRADDFYKKLDSDASSESQESEDGDLKIWNPEPWTSLEEEMFNNATAYRRIYGGKKTNILTFPFVVSIHILQDFTCAGSILSKDLIITAASCLQIHYNNRFFRENPKTTHVRVGSDWISRRGEMVPVLEIYFYPMYDPKTLNHNIAIIRISRTLSFRRHRKNKIRRILIDRDEGNLPSNTDQIKILGWGAKSSSQVINVFQKLTIAKLDVYGIEECREIYSKEYVTRNHFCAGYVSKKTGACNRDVGGPGFTDNFLIGIISFGSPVCGTVDSPTVFTRVGHYAGWIDHIMGLHPIRYGQPMTQTPANKLIIYFNTITTTKIPHVFPLSTSKIQPLMSGYLHLRANENQVITNATGVPDKTAEAYASDASYDGNDTTSQDRPQDNTYDDHDIPNTEKEQNVTQDPVINQTTSLPTTTVSMTTATNYVSTIPVTTVFSTLPSSSVPPKNEDPTLEGRRFDDTNDTNFKYDFNEKHGYDANLSPESTEKYSYVDGNIEGDDVYVANNYD